MKKKIISIVLILVLLLLPFGVLLNVKATGVTFSLDNNTTNGQGKKVLNQVTNGVRVNNVGENDVLAMYKIVDLYYDTTSNQISYGFAGSFGTYANAQNPALTVNDYLTTDTTDTTENHDNKYPDNSDFNALVSDYANYVRTNNVSATYSMTTSLHTANNEYYYYASRTNVEAGIYLVLPSSNPFSTINSDGLMLNNMSVYSVLIANVVPSVSNGEWVFEDVEIDAKKEATIAVNQLADTNVAGFVSRVGGAQVSVDTGTSLNYIAGKNYMGVAINYPVVLPGNAHSSIQDLMSNYTLNMFDIIYPAAVVPNLSNVKFFVLEDVWDSRISNNKYYVTVDADGNPLELEYADVTTSTGKISFDYDNNYLNGFFSIVYNLDIDAASLSNAAAGNTITTISYSIKDPYVDIGSNVTKSDIRAAFDSNDANYNSNKSVNIRKAIAQVEYTSTLYATGVTVNNTNSSNNALSGGEFAVYGSYSNGTYSNQLGSNIVMTNGTGSLNGLDPTQTYYLKQVKAPTGYRLYDDKIIVLPGSNDNTQYDSSTYQVVNVSNGMYTANVVNQANLSLPFTGGSGTVIYTVIGLIILAGAGIFLVLYKKNNKDKNDNKE